MFSSLATTMQGQEAIKIEQKKDLSFKVFVRSKGDGVALKRAEVKLNGQTLYTSKDGTVELKPIKVTDTVEFARFGYENLKLRVGDIVDNEVYLFPKVSDSSEIIIKGKKRPEISKKTFSVNEAKSVAPSGDPAQVTKLLPGVQTSSRGGDNRVVIRGSGPDDSKYFIDDMEVPFLYHTIGNISVIPEQMLSDVEFSSGGFRSEKGDATGGIIKVLTKNTIPERTKYELTLNLPVYSGVFAEQPLDEKSSVSFSARRSYIQYLIPLLAKSSDGIDIDITPYFGDVHAQYLKLVDNGYYKYNIIYAYDGLELVADVPVGSDENGKGNFDLYTSFASVGVQAFRKLSSDWSIKSTPHFRHVMQRIDVLGQKVYITSRGYAIPTEFTLKLGRKEKLYLGFDYQYSITDVDIFAPQPNREDPFFDFEEAPKITVNRQYRGSDAAAWISLDKIFGPVLFSPGLRFFHHGQTKKAGYDPRLNVRLEIGKNNFLKAAWGQYSKPPEVDEASEEFGNLDLDFERSYHHILGWEKNWGDRWATDIQAFYKKTVATIQQNAETNLANTGDAINQGLELFLRHNETARMFGWLSYTYSINKVRETQEKDYHPSQYDQTHVLSLVGHYKLTSQWALGSTFTYNTGNTYTPVDGAVYNANLDKYQPRTDTGDINSKHLDASKKVSIFATKKFLQDTWSLDLRFGVEQYVIGEQKTNLSYNYDYSEEEYVKGVPFIPFLELKAVL